MVFFPNMYKVSRETLKEESTAVSYSNFIVRELGFQQKKSSSCEKS